MKCYYILIFFLSLSISSLMSMEEEEEGLGPLIVYPIIEDTLPTPNLSPSLHLHSVDFFEDEKSAEGHDQELALSLTAAAFSSLSPARVNFTASAPQEEDEEDDDNNHYEYAPSRRRTPLSHRKRTHIKMPSDVLKRFKNLRGKSAEELWALHRVVPFFDEVKKNGRFKEGNLFPCFEKDCTNKHRYFARSVGGSISTHLASIRNGDIKHISCPHCNKLVNEEATALFYHWAINCRGLTEERAQIATLQKRTTAQD